jgi:hypothetical protein
MKGYTFYLEFDSKHEKRIGQHSGNVFALYHGEGIEDAATVTLYRCQPGGLGAVYFRPNSPVNWTNVDRDVIAEKMKRISEQQARAIHPALFARLDSE